jgi:hypothetical protein
MIITGLSDVTDRDHREPRHGTIYRQEKYFSLVSLPLNIT